VKAQVQPLTAALITSVVVLSVAGAFTFGTQVLDKRQAQQNFQSAETQSLELYNSMLDTAEAGQGDTTVLELESEVGSVRLDESKDYLEVITEASSPPYPAETWTLVRGQSTRNLSFGAGDYALQAQDSRGVLAARPSSAAQRSTLRYRVEFRNMLVRTPSGRSLERIDLQARDGQTQASDPESLRIENTGTERDSGNEAVKLSTGEELDRTRTVLAVSFN
jgi:hypothetical protein